MPKLRKKGIKATDALSPQFSDPPTIHLISLIDKLTENHSADIIARLIADPSSLPLVVDEIAQGKALEIRRKLARTSNIMESGPLSSNFAYVGLPTTAEKLEFASGFDAHLRPRLGKRAEGFDVLFQILSQYNTPLIIETGSLRVPGNWEGDGQSTFQFDWYVRERSGAVISIDINPESADAARRACSSATSLLINDSVAALELLSTTSTSTASLIYLDSFDLDLSDPIPSAIHHAMELTAARRLIGPGTLVCVDDFNVPSVGVGGKGLIVDQYMSAIQAKVVYSGYQKIWQILR